MTLPEIDLDTASKVANIIMTVVIPVLAFVVKKALDAKVFELEPDQSAMLRNVTKGAFMVVSKVSQYTENEWDDLIADVLEQINRETGMILGDGEKTKVERHVLSMLADPRLPSPIDDAPSFVRERLEKLVAKEKTDA